MERVLTADPCRWDPAPYRTTAAPFNPAVTFRKKVPEPIRFACAGFLGSAAFWVLNEATVAVLPTSLPQVVTLAWFIAYVISIWFQHALLASLVYGWGKSYCKGLAATYAGYSGALVASVPINAALVNSLALTPSEAWVGTLGVTGAANYFLLSELLGSKEDASGATVQPAKGVSAEEEAPLFQPSL